MGKGEVLGELEAVVMLAVARVQGLVHGAAVHREIQETTGRDVSIPTVHVTLARLEGKGYLSCSLESDPRGRRARKLFSLTRAGITQLELQRRQYDRLWQGVTLSPSRKGGAT
jgi:DNA-binding PadR family transcriptional regulator